ncbi:hypothetical protein AB0B45_50475 [Nonomuraea sp. NPDC049152]|uniref:hypothetical protein n=1 Tax=Nonomuraea sp. NPDC049152 TaxID=3154350 RepID=UPI00340C53B0
MPWGARGGYTATFTGGVLESVSSMGFDGKPTGSLTAYTAQITPASVLPAFELTLQVDRKVNGTPAVKTQR